MPVVRSGRTEPGPCHGPDCDHVSHHAEAEAVDAIEDEAEVSAGQGSNVDATIIKPLTSENTEVPMPVFRAPGVTPDA